ncbi:2-hydroxyacid dehydrogenase [Pelosinus sp. sgz500959]|uniref:2-hydroxyacid dehydrogenase n=1 Tax=Pelosinus sp. sgz500959 TaxID=3242472 RepID=UPI00366D3068
MSKPSVYVTRLLPVETLVMLKERCDVEMNPGYEVLPKEELLAKLAGKDAVLVSHTEIDEEICQAIQSHCKILASYGVGYNNIDVDAATKYGMYVSNNPDAVTAATADLTWTLLLNAARRTIESDRYVRSGKKDWGPTNMLGTQVSGKTFGIVGGGRVGTAVGKRAKGFDMKIIYTDVQANPVFEEATGGAFVDKETLLKEADFISLHVPLLPATHHFIGANELKLMKKTAILVNAARGPLVDEKALVEALQNKTIAGAGLDVFEHEPDLEPELIELSNVVLTPHIGTSTMDARIQQGEGCARNIFAVLDGKMPPNCLNPKVKESC